MISARSHSFSPGNVDGLDTYLYDGDLLVHADSRLADDSVVFWQLDYAHDAAGNLMADLSSDGELTAVYGYDCW